MFSIYEKRNAMLGVKVVLLSLLGISVALDLDGCFPNEPKWINPLTDGLEGDIYSPGYKDGEYPSDLQCQYTIRATPGFKLKLTFVDFDLELLDMCAADSLAIFEGIGQPNSPIHGVFCGNGTYTDIISVSNALTLLFRTDFINNRKGFHLKYKASAILQPCSFGESMCRNRKCFVRSQHCDGNDDCGDGTDEEGCGITLPTTTCGVRRNDTSSSVLSPDRIVGGKEAIPGSWPWQADLQLSYMFPNGHMCGGTLINAQWVLTASHCVMDQSHPSFWRIHIGNHNKFKKDKYEQVRYVTFLVSYPNKLEVTEETLDIVNDIALMKLNAPVIFNDRVRPACLPNENLDLKPGTKCMTTGWGATRGSGSSDNLKELELTIEDASVCKNDMVQIDNKTMICTSYRGRGNHDVCHGDSGGPLVCKINGEWQVVGDTSFGTDTNLGSGLCGLRDTYSVYNRVSAKIKWIQDTINKFS